ncbi:uncharacterized protein LOC117735478 isoform X2 [Cyclopterus lumpus]|uniref:uncharacterized protein LOC117735478 isoform X2 n=1 Tax=Cyclopterus lumpus TaxID=8103 RepID=UPI0014874929|nr:uncharacterized protein LOC117735478 isoform X2 [Cyclopterus lumpus]
MGDILVQASKYNLVLLYTEERQRYLNDKTVVLMLLSSQSHLRGHYYIYTVQSVREVQRVDGKRFMFEIMMTNGKKKVLAAETAALRKEWLGLLWQAMNLSTSGVTYSRSTHLEVCEQRERLNSSTPVSSHSVMESLLAQALSAPSGHIQHETRSISSLIRLSEESNHEETASGNTPPDRSYQHHNGHSVDNPQRSSGLNHAEDVQEGDYDILPLRNKVCEINTSTEMDEGEYDFPLSYRRAAEHPKPTESIYDVPSSRSMPDHTLEEQPEDGVYWRI